MSCSNYTQVNSIGVERFPPLSRLKCRKSVLTQGIEMTICSNFEAILLLRDMNSYFHRSGG